MSAEIIHRLHFAFTVTFHYLFPQLTMGLALLIVAMKTVALRTGSEAKVSEKWDRAARFWGRIFAINFVMGVVTGIPMEFQFGTNWARFSQLSGGVIGNRWRWKASSHFSWSRVFWGCFCLAKNAWVPEVTGLLP